MHTRILALAAAALLIPIASGQTPSAEHSKAAAKDTLPAKPVAKDTPPALNAPLKHGLQIITSFSAASGLRGWVMRDPSSGEYIIFYTTADGQTLFAGELMTSTGQDLSAQYVQRYVPPPDLSGLWKKLQNAAVVVTGTTKAPKSVIYVIMDPNCIFCHMLWIALKPYERAGLQVRWVPVGFLHEDSPAKAAALLKGGATALDQAQEHFDVKAESGSIKGIAITPDLKAKLDSNLQLMNDANLQGTPGTFYKDALGRVLQKDGMPSLSQLPSITLLPKQAEPDPQLAQFRD